MKKILTKAYNSYFDFKSITTHRKLLVIESDDWGSLRTKDTQVLKYLNKINTAIVKDPYSRLDSIANTDDLNALFDVLNSVRDRNGNPACITTNTCMANPDFEKIKQSKFQQFYYKPFHTSITETGGVALWDLWQEGIGHKFLRPQLHGREHLHSLQWLEELKAGNNDLLKAFELESFGIPYEPLLTKRRKNLQAALDHYGLKGEKEFQENWLKESADIFEKTFGYTSKTFIPTAYIWHSQLDQIIKKQGIKAYQGIKLQYQPKDIGYKRIPHFIGQKKNSLRYLVRNAFFEPSLEPNKNWLSTTLKDIENAFAKNQPAIVGSHRINFIGGLSEQNRDQNLKLLKQILIRVIKIYPDVEFVNSSLLLNITSVHLK